MAESEVSDSSGFVGSDAGGGIFDEMRTAIKDQQEAIKQKQDEAVTPPPSSPIRGVLCHLQCFSARRDVVYLAFVLLAHA